MQVCKDIIKMVNLSINYGGRQITLPLDRRFQFKGVGIAVIQSNDMMRNLDFRRVGYCVVVSWIR